MPDSEEEDYECDGEGIQVEDAASDEESISSPVETNSDLEISVLESP